MHSVSPTFQRKQKGWCSWLLFVPQCERGQVALYILRIWMILALKSHGDCRLRSLAAGLGFLSFDDWIRSFELFTFYVVLDRICSGFLVKYMCWTIERSCRLKERINSTYNGPDAEFMNEQFHEVSGHNLESSQTWGFCMDFLNHWERGVVFYQVFLLSPLQKL